MCGVHGILRRFSNSRPTFQLHPAPVLHLELISSKAFLRAVASCSGEHHARIRLYTHLPNLDVCEWRQSLLKQGGVGETGYGCHTFYITDVFRNIVIIADIRLLLCLNIVSCAHTNMQMLFSLHKK